MESNKNKGVSIFNLTPYEINNPILAVQDFISDDSLPGHLERLQMWRKCILEDQYFKGDKGSPAELLYFYKLNIRLVEAVYLLRSNQDAISKETHFPQVVINRIFEDYDLRAYREILYEWLEFGLSNRAANEIIETVDLIKVYENLQTLYDLVFKIDLLPNEKYLDKNTTLYKLDYSVGSRQQETISRLVAIVNKKVLSVQAIIYLGQPPVGSEKYFLLIIVNDSEQDQLQCLASRIEESCRGVASVTALVHRPSRLYKPGGDNLFFSMALNCPAVYLSGELLLPVIKMVNHGVPGTAILNWQRWSEQAKDFLKGAEYYMTMGADNAALYSLQQAAECLLVAIIRAVNEYSISIHNLSTLLELTKMFTNDIANVFDLENEDGKQLFNVLKHAYINVRYKDAYEVDKGDVEAIYPYIKRLMVVVEKVYDHHLLISNL